MRLHNLVQGSPQWHHLRKDYFTASEAPVMMGASSKMSRDDLLTFKTTNIEKEISRFLQLLFDKGHASEASARPITENIIGEELFPATGTETVEGLPLLASFDGLTMLANFTMEHKLWNLKLAEQINNEDIDPEYYWQLEHQLLVSEAECCLFVCSDGTSTNMAWCWYYSDEERRAQLIAGWHQFKKDLDGYQPVIYEPAPLAQSVEVLPSLNIQLTGQVNSTNLVQYQAGILDFIEQINTDLETDQDFADAQAVSSKLEDAEKELKSVERQALSQTADIKHLFDSINQIGKAMGDKRRHLNRLIKERKEAIKVKAVTDGKQAILDHINSINQTLDFPLPAVNPDFAKAIKSKRTIKTLTEAVNDLVAQTKIEITAMENTIRQNMAAFKELTQGYEFLFHDLGSIINNNPDHLKLIIESRIREHKEKEQERIERDKERARILAESKVRNEIELERMKKERSEQASATPAEQVLATQPQTTPASADDITFASAEADDITFRPLQFNQPLSPADFETITHLVSKEDQQALRFDEDGTEYEIDMVLVRVKIKDQKKTA